MSKPTRVAVLLASLVLLAGWPAGADELCATSPFDTPLAGGGVVNTYYPPLNQGTLPAGSTSIPLGTPAGAQAIADGDLLLIIQMQDATFNSNNDDRYGDATEADENGQGLLDPRQTGKFEYVVALGPVAPLTGVLPIKGEGNNAGTLNAYTNADATPSEGQRRFQVIRVPRYLSLDMTAVGGSFEAGYWDGAKGGVLALQVAGTLTLSATNRLTATARGFRGGMGQRLGGVVGASNVDYRYPSLDSFDQEGAHGNKAEGIAGTPRYVRVAFPAADLNTGVEGYPGGSRARGAPGNAGGGGTDSAPQTNNSAAGGGGGGNGGPGGQGGETSDNQPLGGHGGAAFVDADGDPLWGPGRLVMGGGGGAGTKNDGSPDESFGSSGGGIVMIAVNSFAGTGIIEANGLDHDNGAGNQTNDGGGGGGAGGSILIVTKNSVFTGVNLTVSANGGEGENAGTGTSILGPGGGGGGGVVLMTPFLGGTVTVSTIPGANGTTRNGASPIPHGANTGTVGTPTPGTGSNEFINPASLVPGADSAAECAANAAPVNSVPGPQGTLLNINLEFSTANGNVISISDVDAAGDDVQVIVSVDSGTLTVDGTAVGVVVANDGTGAVTLTGPVAAINEALNPLLFDPDLNSSAPVVLTIFSDDLGNNGAGGPLTDTDTVNITVGNQNLPPSITVPTAQATSEDVALTFSATGNNRISVTDPDLAPGTMVVTVTVTSGTLTTASLVGVTGSGTGTVTITGTLAQVEAALGPAASATGLTFTPEADQSDPVTLTITANDQGWSLGGAPSGVILTDQATVAIGVTAVNDAPVAVDNTYTIANDRVLIETGSGILTNDDDGGGEGQTLSVVLPVTPPASGTLVLNSDGSFTYTPVFGFFGVVTFTYQATDGTNLSNIATVSIDVGGGGYRQRAGYCGLTGLEVFAVLAALRIRRLRRSRGR